MVLNIPFARLFQTPGEHHFAGSEMARKPRRGAYQDDTHKRPSLVCVVDSFTIPFARLFQTPGELPAIPGRKKNPAEAGSFELPKAAYIMPPMPPMPPPMSGIAGAGLSSGTSATIASVVINRPAMEAAF